MKTCISLFLLFISSMAVASSGGSVFQIDCDLSEKGQLIESSGFTAQKGKPAEVKTENELKLVSCSAQTKSKNHFLISYLYKNIKSGQSIKLDKIKVPAEPGVFETDSFKNADGSDYQLKITVTKK